MLDAWPSQGLGSGVMVLDFEARGELFSFPSGSKYLNKECLAQTLLIVP